MKKLTLSVALLASAAALTMMSGCVSPDHSGVYMDQHHGREEQSNADGRRDDGYHRDDGYRGDNRGYDRDRRDDRRDDNYSDPRRQ